MADLLILISLMFAGAALALSGFALGQSVERRRWMAWVRPKKRKEPSVFGGWVGGRFKWRDDFWWDEAAGAWLSGGHRGPKRATESPVPPTGGSSISKPSMGARDV